MGVNKYKQLDMQYQINDQVALDEEDLTRIKSYFDENDFEVAILKH